MRLLLFNMATDVDHPGLGFATRWIGALARHVESIDVITMLAGRLAVPENVRVYSVGKERGYSEPRRVAEFYRHLFRILRTERIDVCFSHMIPAFTILASPVLRTLNIPIVTWYAHKSVTPILKVAHHVSQRMVTSVGPGYGYRHDKLTIVGQGIDTRLFSPNGAQPVPSRRLLHVGRLSPIKDLVTLIQAVGLLRKNGIEMECDFVGEASEREQSYGRLLVDTTKELGLEEAVRFVGGVSNDRVTRWYQQCFAHVNLTETGALDKSALEALACGRPSLVANEGFRDTLGNWTEPLLFEHRNPSDLARRLEQLLAMDEASRRRMGSELRESVIGRHSLDRLVERLLEVFETVRRSR